MTIYSGTHKIRSAPSDAVAESNAKTINTSENFGVEYKVLGWGPNIDTKGSLVGIILEIRASNDYPDSEFPSNIHVKFGDQMVPSKRIPGPAPFIAPDDPLNIVTIVTLIAPVPEAPETEDEFTNKQVPVNLVVFGPVEFHVHCGIFTYTDKVVNEVPASLEDDDCFDSFIQVPPDTIFSGTENLKKLFAGMKVIKEPVPRCTDTGSFAPGANVGTDLDKYTENHIPVDKLTEDLTLWLEMIKEQNRNLSYSTLPQQEQSITRSQQATESPNKQANSKTGSFDHSPIPLCKDESYSKGKNARTTKKGKETNQDPIASTPKSLPCSLTPGPQHNSGSKSAIGLDKREKFVIVRYLEDMKRDWSSDEIKEGRRFVRFFRLKKLETEHKMVVTFEAVHKKSSCCIPCIELEGEYYFKIVDAVKVVEDLTEIKLDTQKRNVIKAAIQFDNDRVCINIGKRMALQWSFLSEVLKEVADRYLQEKTE